LKNCLYQKTTYIKKVAYIEKIFALKNYLHEKITSNIKKKEITKNMV